MSFAALAVAAVVGAGASAYGSYAESEAQGKAIDSQKKAIKRLKEIDIPDYISKARLGDKEQLLAKYEDLRETDPTLSAVRSESTSQMLDLIRGASNPAKSLLNELVAEGRVQVSDPRYRALEDALIDRAKTRLDEPVGSPALWGEYLSRNIEKGATSFGPSGVGKESPLAQIIGKTYLPFFNQLRATQENEAMGLAQGASVLKQNRFAILSGLLPAAEQEREQQFNMAGKGLTTAFALGPAGGIGGKEILNLNEANRQLYNQQQLALGQLSAQRNLKNGQENAGYAQAISSLVSSLAGMGGTGASTGSILSGLFSSNSAPVQYYGAAQPNANTYGGSYYGGSGVVGGTKPSLFEGLF